MVAYVPKRGDIAWLEFDPQKGKEIQKTRPALVISPYQYNLKTGLGLFMPITSQVKGYPFEVAIECGDVQGAVLCDQIRSLDWKARKARLFTQLSEDILSEILAKFKVLID
jgi:mRNA interferase MazF